MFHANPKSEQETAYPLATRSKFVSEGLLKNHRKVVFFELERARIGLNNFFCNRKREAVLVQIKRERFSKVITGRFLDQL